MEVTRALRIEALREQIDRSEYDVDPGKVAEAILGRPTAHLWLVPAPVCVVEPGGEGGWHSPDVNTSDVPFH